MKPEAAIVTIHSVREEATRNPQYRRFLITAEQTTGASSGERVLGLTTLDEWKASLCRQSKLKGFPLAITYRATGYFDRDLLSVELVKDEQVSA